MPSRPLVFDLDGTLVDTLDDIAAHLNAALVDHGLAPRSRVEIAEWVGHGSARLVERAVSEPAAVAAVLASYRAHYHARPVVHARMYDGIAAALDALAPHHVLAILSNKPEPEVVAIAQALLARWPFAVIAGERADVPRKPDPASIARVLAQLGASASAGALVGDSEVDIATARAAGMTSVAVTWGFRREAALRAASPDHLVHAPAELAALLD
ncbi:MAG TPA: HAD-IA family hydrolase [Kofleriaceae bacterium]|nr:HAD-IA family hydrolase [Kofleriaceae bacterium]